MNVAARLLGLVSTEGGPLLIADRDVAAGWTGVVGTDYQRALDLLDGDPGLPGCVILVDVASGVLWDIPTGTAEVWRRGPARLTLSRPWLDPGADLSDQLANLPHQRSAPLGEIEIRSGWLAIMWSGEDGREVLAVEPEDGAALELSVGHAGLIAKLPVGRYVLTRDEVDLAAGSSLRCLVDPSVEDR